MAELVFPAALVITQGSTVLSNEPMLEYWSDWSPKEQRRSGLAGRSVLRVAREPAGQ